ncbi:MAG: DNA repair protein RecN [Chitinivibrionales bacterium]|nr:DNA repair protein RecN [Chitinivibrionales bacterium]MBD3396389.1 DNA repair protein RecN [Chitinivibrionales bacterium]
MLRELRIKNLALIDDLALDLTPGLTVFTGETGAGKSILVGAVGLLLGERASSESIRSGTDEAEISGVLEFDRLSPALSRLLAETGIEADDGTLILRRTLARTGRNRIRINQVPVPLATLRTLGDLLVDLHGQHEHQSLLKADTPRILIDSLPAVSTARRAYDSAWLAYAEARSALENHEHKARELAAKRDVLEFQHHELASLHLEPGEEQRLEEDLRRISSVSERLECIAAIAGALGGGEDGDALDHRLALVKKHLESLARYDERARTWLDDMENALAFVPELERFAESYRDEAELASDPAAVDALNARLAKIQRLKKKHSCGYEGLLETQHRLKQDLDSLENMASDRAVLAGREAETKKACSEAGAELSTARASAARELDKRVGASMARLGFTDGKWQTAFLPEPAIAQHGLEELQFMVKTNPGEPFLPLAKIASGGEISRLMLAVKTFMAEKDHIPVLIFDEVDSGIGGLLAREVGAALRKLSRTHQVLCISHLHQIASRADEHVLVYKTMEGSRTVTRARKLSGDEKIDEITRMLGGESDISKEHARELLNKAGME